MPKPPRPSHQDHFYHLAKTSDMITDSRRATQSCSDLQWMFSPSTSSVKLRQSLNSRAHTPANSPKILQLHKFDHHAFQTCKRDARTAKVMIPPGFEPGTACVLDRSDNQLHHRTNLIGKWLIAEYINLHNGSLWGLVAVCLRSNKCLLRIAVSLLSLPDREHLMDGQRVSHTSTKLKVEEGSGRQSQSKLFMTKQEAQSIKGG